MRSTKRTSVCQESTQLQLAAHLKSHRHRSQQHTSNQSRTFTPHSSRKTIMCQQRGTVALKADPESLRRKIPARNKRTIMQAAIPSAAVISDSEHDSSREDVRPTKVVMEKEYHDHAYEREPGNGESDDTDSYKRRGPRGGVSHPFPEKLHIMLDTVEQEGLDHIVSWHPHGRSFAVHKPKEFVAEIM